MTYMSAKTQRMTAQQYGNWFEWQVQTVLDEMVRDLPLAFSRLYDTKAAGSYLPNQAGDFRGTHRGRGFLLEVKSSLKYDSLAAPGALKGLIKSHQALASYLEHRAGGAGHFLFRSPERGVVEIWDGAVVREAYVTPRGNLKGLAGARVREVGIADSDLPKVLYHLMGEHL